jgi:hypothetical protein
MTRKTMVAMLLGLSCAVGALLVGCEDHNNETLPAVNVTGTWSWNNGAGLEGILSLAPQADADVTGTFRLAGAISDSGTVVGEIEGNHLTLKFKQPSGDMGDMAADVTGDSMSGTWTGSRSGATSPWAAVRK